MQMSKPSRMHIKSWHSRTVSIFCEVVFCFCIQVSYQASLYSDPDKWRADSSHGLSKEESTDKFIVIQNAADGLLSKFDDEEESHSSQDPSQASSYENEQDIDDQEMEDEFEDFDIESDDEDEDKIGRHFNMRFPDMPSFDEFQSIQNMTKSRQEGVRIKISKGLDNWMQAEMRMRMEEGKLDGDGEVGCVTS